MSTRTLLSRSTLGAGLAVAAALVSLTCGGGAGPESVTGQEVAVARGGEGEAGQVSALATDKDKDRVDVCHYDAVTGTYSELMVPGSALDPHLGHGDFVKPYDDYDCTQGPPSPCPCFSAYSIDSGVSQCEGGAKECFTSSTGFVFSYYCAGAYVVEVGVDTSSPSCASLDVDEIEISQDQYDSCVAEIRASQEISTYCLTLP
jgi:hypothetical protein